MSRARVAVAVALCLLAVSCSEPIEAEPASRIGVVGDLKVLSDGTCSDSDGPANSFVMIFSQDGTTMLGHTDLGFGWPTAGQCHYSWSISDVPDNRRSYVVQIGRRLAQVDGDAVRRQDRLGLVWEDMKPRGG
jgi:hypothetical protein